MCRMIPDPSKVALGCSVISEGLYNAHLLWLLAVQKLSPPKKERVLKSFEEARKEGKEGGKKGGKEETFKKSYSWK